MENFESILLDLEEFNRGSEEEKLIPQNLEKFIEHVAKTGTYIFPWIKIKKLYLQKLKNVLTNLNLSSNESIKIDMSNIEQLKERIIDRMKSFTSAPFTIQRISELLLKPNNHYTRPDKYLRGLEKCVMVVTTVDPNGNKIFVDNFFTNGVSNETEITNPARPSTPICEAETSVLSNNIEMTTESVSINETSVSISIESNNLVATETVCMQIEKDQEQSEHIEQTEPTEQTEQIEQVQSEPKQPQVDQEIPIEEESFPASTKTPTLNTELSETKETSESIESTAKIEDIESN